MSMRQLSKPQLLLEVTRVILFIRVMETLHCFFRKAVVGAGRCGSLPCLWHRHGSYFCVYGLSVIFWGSCGSKPGLIWCLPCDINQNFAAVGSGSRALDGRDLNAWKEALAKPAKLVFFETPSNPVLHLVDIEAVSTLAHAAGAKVIVDNVFATPLFQSPLALGADIVTYSTTKHIDGHGRLLGGPS